MKFGKIVKRIKMGKSIKEEYIKKLLAIECKHMKLHRDRRMSINELEKRLK